MVSDQLIFKGSWQSWWNEGVNPNVGVIGDFGHYMYLAWDTVAGLHYWYKISDFHVNFHHFL